MPDANARYQLEGRVARVVLDDGKANAISLATLELLNGYLDRAQKEAGAGVVLGRPGCLSGGFDLATMRSGNLAAVRGLVRAGAELFLRLYEYPLPVVAGCTGHAVAAGAILLLSVDTRIGAEGNFKIGLPEVTIRMTLPVFAFELARERLSKRHFVRATSQAEMYAPNAALEAGYLDRVVPAAELGAACLAEASRLAELPQPAFGASKLAVNREAVARIRASLDENVGGFARALAPA
jgi:enoyl-CoA hydratase